MDIMQIDKNFYFETSIKEPDIEWKNISECQFNRYGLIVPDQEEDFYRRIPTTLANSINDGVAMFCKSPAGGRVRFCTNAKYIAIHAEMFNVKAMSHFATTGVSGFDMYVYDENEGREKYVGVFRPEYNIKDGYETIIRLPQKGYRTYTINFPLYSGVKALYIGTPKDSDYSEPRKYRYEAPVVYYGSSITQGACVSRPGNAYEAILSRMCDCNFINLGFAGSALGEKEMAEYISLLDMSVFVLDYDHNAPTPEYLRETHYPFYKIIREKNPELPIIMVTRPALDREYAKPRYDVIKETYETAKKNGDKNVYFVDGGTFYQDFAGDSATVDGTHPNDLGFMCIAKAIEPVLKEALKFDDFKV